MWVRVCACVCVRACVCVCVCSIGEPCNRNRAALRYNYTLSLQVSPDGTILLRRSPLNGDSSSAVAPALFVDVSHAPRTSGLHRLGCVLGRLESLSHVLVWTSHGHGTEGAKVLVTSVDLPRLGTGFVVQRNDAGVATPDVSRRSGEAGARLYSTDHTGLFITDQQPAHLVPLLRGLPAALLLESDGHQLFVMVPHHPFQRSVIQECPFSTHVLQMRGDAKWRQACRTRMYG